MHCYSRSSKDLQDGTHKSDTPLTKPVVYGITELRGKYVSNGPSQKYRRYLDVAKVVVLRQQRENSTNG